MAAGPSRGGTSVGTVRRRSTAAAVTTEPDLEEPAVSSTGRGRGSDEDESPAAPPIPSFASLRAPRRTHAALDVLLAPAQPQQPLPPVPPPVQEAPPVVAPATSARPRPAEWPDLLWFSVRVASAAFRLPGVLVREPARRLLRLLGE